MSLSDEKQCYLIVYDKYTGKREYVYAVLEDSNGYPKFLVRRDNKWIYRSAKHYITRVERLKTPYGVVERFCGVEADMI